MSAATSVLLIGISPLAKRPSPGCLTQGHTREEPAPNARDAISQSIVGRSAGVLAGWLGGVPPLTRAMEDQHLPVPSEHFDALVVAV